MSTGNNVGGWVALIVIIAIIVGVVWLKIWIKNSQDKEDSKDGVIARVNLPGGPLRFTATELLDGLVGTPHPLAGLTARVEDAGTLNRRITATRLVALGVFALAAPKKQDDRVLYLTIEGPSTAILRAVPLKNGGTVLATQVRKFAMQLNQASAALTRDESSRPTA